MVALWVFLLRGHLNEMLIGHVFVTVVADPPFDIHCEVGSVVVIGGHAKAVEPHVSSWLECDAIPFECTQEVPLAVIDSSESSPLLHGLWSGT